jgi:hypothetical protein
MKTPYLDDAIRWMKSVSNQSKKKNLKEYEEIKQRLLTDDEFGLVLEFISFYETMLPLNPKDKELKNKIEKILK